MTGMVLIESDYISCNHLHDCSSLSQHFLTDYIIPCITNGHLLFVMGALIL